MDIDPKVREAVENARVSSRFAKGYYDPDAEGWLIDMHKLDTKVLDDALPRPCKLFDATMGPGRHVIHFAQRGFEVSGNDYNPHMVEEAKKALKGKKLKAKLFNLDATSLSGIKSNHYDAVICMGSSLGCIPKSHNRMMAMREFARIAKPGAILVMHFNNLWSFTYGDVWTIGFSLFNRRKGYEFGDSYFHHSDELGYFFNHIFCVSEVKKMFKDVDLIIENIVCLDRQQERFKPRWLPQWMCGGFFVIAKKPSELKTE
ncbi:MAG: class I SAM-dependent methyltransferase [Nanoarchaeota archaeon]